MNVNYKATYYVLSLASGCLWAAIGYYMAEAAMGSIVWGGVIASPLIGCAVAAIFQPACGFGFFRRVFLSLATLYFAVGLFGLGAGIYDAFRPMPPEVNRITWAVIVQSVLGCWWRLTVTGLFIVLWPLSFVNHALVCRFGRV
jgi:hypothetical protein